jgi:hypothetical protein
VHVAGVRDPFVTPGRVAHAATKTRALRSLGEPGLNSCTYFHPETVTWAFGTQAAVVEVDAETFAVRLLADAIVHDPGRAIHPVIVEAQLQGGAVQGLAAGLFEHAAHDATGQVLTGSFMDYAIPRARPPAAPRRAPAARLRDQRAGRQGRGRERRDPGRRRDCQCGRGRPAPRLEAHRDDAGHPVRGLRAPAGPAERVIRRGFPNRPPAVRMIQGFIGMGAAGALGPPA